jgi:hypothetical protein
MCLIREPEAAVTSLVTRAPHLTTAVALRGYLRFYEAILPVADDIVIAPFSDVSVDFGRVVQRLNARYSTSFGEFTNAPDAVADVFRIIEEHSAATVWQDAIRAYMAGAISRGELDSRRDPTAQLVSIPETRVARPSLSRPGLARSTDPASASLLRRADSLYIRLVHIASHL